MLAVAVAAFERLIALLCRVSAAARGSRALLPTVQPRRALDRRGSLQRVWAPTIKTKTTTLLLHHDLHEEPRALEESAGPAAQLLRPLKSAFCEMLRTTLGRGTTSPTPTPARIVCASQSITTRKSSRILQWLRRSEETAVWQQPSEIRIASTHRIANLCRRAHACGIGQPCDLSSHSRVSPSST